MLVLSRNVGEKIILDLRGVTPEDLQKMQADGSALCEVCFVDLRVSKVRIGINAPRCIGVHREEVFEAMEADRKAVAS